MIVYQVEEAVLIQGTVFHDTNSNGVMDTVELGLGGVTLTLDGLDTVMSDSAGYYAFAVTTIGVHEVVETDPPGYSSTTPNTVIVDVVDADITVNFGDYFEGGVEVDVKPGSSVNPINLRSNGVLPVAIMGSADLDVMSIDPTTIMLQGVAPIRWNCVDLGSDDEDPLAGPLDADPMDDMGISADGYLDMTLKFRTQEIAAAIGEVERDDIITLTLTGYLEDGSPISGTETVRIVQVPKE
jgi:hypothetical protein